MEENRSPRRDTAVASRGARNGHNWPRAGSAHAPTGWPVRSTRRGRTQRPRPPRSEGLAPGSVRFSTGAAAPGRRLRAMSGSSSERAPRHATPCGSEGLDVRETGVDLQSTISIVPATKAYLRGKRKGGTPLLVGPMWTSFFHAYLELSATAMQAFASLSLRQFKHGL